MRDNEGHKMSANMNTFLLRWLGGGGVRGWRDAAKRKKDSRTWTPVW